MSWDPIHNFLDLICRGGGKKARERWRKAERRERDIRAKKHVVTDPNIGWDRGEAHYLGPNTNGSFNFKQTVEDRDETINNFRRNDVLGLMQPTPRYRDQEEMYLRDLSRQALALGVMARNSSGGRAQRSPMPSIPQMPSPRFRPRFGNQGRDFQETSLTEPPPYVTQDPRFRPPFEISQERSSILGFSDISRGPRAPRSWRDSELNSRQLIPSQESQGFSSGSTQRENTRSPSQSHQSRRLQSESGPRIQQSGGSSHIPFIQASSSSTIRMRTSQAPLGDMSRTFVEGMVPIEEDEEEVERPLPPRCHRYS